MPNPVPRQNLSSGQVPSASATTTESLTAAGKESTRDGTVWSALLSAVARSTILRTLLVLIVIVIVFAGLQPGFLSANNVETIVTVSAILGVVSLGQTVVLVSGGFDLSVGGMVPLGAVLFVYVMLHGVPLVPAILLTVTAGGVVGVINAIIVGRLKVNALITTLGTLSITGGVAYILAGGGTLVLPPSDGVLGNAGPLWGLPFFVWISVGLAVAVDVMLRRTVAGRLIYALGGNIEACRVAGIRVEMVRLGAYVVSGAFAGLAGLCYASQALAGSGSIGTTTTLDSLTAAVLGGAALTGGLGSAPGAVLGVLIMGTISEGLTVMQVESFYQQIISGAVLIFAVALMAANGATLRALVRIIHPAPAGSSG